MKSPDFLKKSGLFKHEICQANTYLYMANFSIVWYNYIGGTSL